MFHTIYYGNELLNGAQWNYTITEQEPFVVVYAFETLKDYQMGTKVIFHTDGAALRYILTINDVKPRMIWWVILFW